MTDTTQKEEKPSKPRWRWWSFSLRGLLVATVVCGCGLGWVSRQLAHHDRQVQAYRKANKFMLVKEWAPPDWLVFLGLGNDVRRFDVVKRVDVYTYVPTPDFSPTLVEVERHKFAFRTLLDFPDVEVVDFVDCFPSTQAEELEAVAKHPSLRSVKMGLHLPHGQQAKIWLTDANPSLKVEYPDQLGWQYWDVEFKEFLVPYWVTGEAEPRFLHNGSITTANSPKAEQAK